MDTTAPALAKKLGVSLPTAHRALDKLGVPRSGHGHTRHVPDDALESLIATRGSTPLSNIPASELRVLAALSRAPLGLPSARSVATQAGVSPTTASQVLHALESRRLVVRVSAVFAHGRAIKEHRWKAVSSSWPEQLRTAVRHTRLPQAPQIEPTTTALPRSLRHIFWNADVVKLSPDTDGSYLAGRLLATSDIRAWRWALNSLSTADIDKAMSRRGVSPSTRALVKNWSHSG